MVNPNAKKPAPITSAAGASLGPMLGTAAEYQKTLLFPQHNLIRRSHAWKRRAAVGRVQLHQSRAASSAGPSTTFAAGHGRWALPSDSRVRSSVEVVMKDLYQVLRQKEM